MIVNPLLVFVLGIIVGSFLNAVIYRYHTGQSVNGRSRCLSCGKNLRWYELVPIFSFIFQGGRCRHCQSKVSWQYPLVELATGLAFFLTWQLSLPLISKLVYLVIACLLMVIVVYDLRHLIIPDGFVYGFIALALAHAVWLSANFVPQFSWAFLLNYILTGLGLAAFFWGLWLISRGRWLGFADGKLALGIGFLLGPVAGISAVVLAFWSGAIVGVALMIVSKLSAHRGRVTMKSELPFAPFLILGLALVVFLNLNVLPL